MAMVLSSLNYANSFLFGHSASNMAKLQRIQNTAASTVLDTKCPFPAQQLRCHLYWLPVHFCINYKTATLTCMVLAHNQLL